MFKINEFKIIGIYVGMLIVLLGFQLLLIYGFNLNVDIQSQFIRVNSLSNIFYYGMMLLLYIVLFFGFWKTEWRKAINNKIQVLMFIVIGFGAMLGASTIAGIIMYILNVTDTSVNQAQLNLLISSGTTFDQIALLIFAVLLAPPVEELVFRKAIFDLLERIKIKEPFVVILLSGIIFGFIHVASDNWIQIVSYALLGVVLALLYHYSNKKLFIPIVVHMLFNLMVSITMFTAL
ncbi:MAG: CPBP family intramembrane glutamic endopeptidase [Candidatus Izemoplasma sp.]|nr:CPBP family intramembrane glutamic endopeptidase [Candidatus Izemoplasma sp.]